MKSNTQLNSIKANVIPFYEASYISDVRAHRLCLYGNVEELLIGTVNKDIARMLMHALNDQVNKFAFGYQGGFKMPACGQAHDRPFLFNGRLEIVPLYQSVGFVIDDEFRACIEDGSGNAIFDLTSKLKEQAGPVHANDNDILYEMGDFNGQNTNPICSIEKAQCGVVNARSFERGTCEATFETGDGFDPWLLNVPLQNMTTHHVTAEATYNGIPAVDFSINRWSVNPPRATVGIATV